MWTKDLEQRFLNLLGEHINPKHINLPFLEGSNYVTLCFPAGNVISIAVIDYPDPNFNKEVIAKMGLDFLFMVDEKVWIQKPLLTRLSAAGFNKFFVYSDNDIFLSTDVSKSIFEHPKLIRNYLVDLLVSRNFAIWKQSDLTNIYNGSTFHSDEIKNTVSGFLSRNLISKKLPWNPLFKSQDKYIMKYPLLPASHQYEFNEQAIRECKRRMSRYLDMETPHFLITKIIKKTKIKVKED